MIIKEGKAKIEVQEIKKISKKMEVFYNPVMEANRSISILLLNALNKKDMQIALPLSGSGIRGIRFLLELDKDKINTISFNDLDPNFKNIIKKNINKNNIKVKKIMIKNEDANLFLLNSTGFDYIDIDPFGSPNPFLDSAIRRLAREGILAITATDTAALTGTYPQACRRKYWAKPLHNELMHEMGLRILIRKIQLVGAQYDKALMPVFSYSKDHYFRIFFICEKGKKDVDEILNFHKFFEGSGPLWAGQLWDRKITLKMVKENRFDHLDKFLKIIKEESKIDVIGFFDIHKIVKRNKIKKIPRKIVLLEKIRKLGYKASETHFSDTGIRSDIELKKLISLLRR